MERSGLKSAQSSSNPPDQKTKSRIVGTALPFEGLLLKNSARATRRQVLQRPSPKLLEATHRLLEGLLLIKLQRGAFAHGSGMERQSSCQEERGGKDCFPLMYCRSRLYFSQSSNFGCCTLVHRRTIAVCMSNLDHRLTHSNLATTLWNVSALN